MTIENARVVYVLAPSGTGKSFTGDYLAVVHGFKHVDGDGPFKMMYQPKYRDMTKKLLQIFELRKQCNDLDPESSREMLAPYFEELADRTLEAAKDHDNVVLSHATYFQIARDIVLDALVKGGINPERITLLELTIDPDVKYRGLYARTKRMAAQGGMMLIDLVKSWGVTAFDDVEGELPEERYVEWMKAFESDPGNSHFDVCRGATRVDVSRRDMTYCDGVDAALGLARGEEWSDYEEIVDRVKPVDERRDVEYGDGWKETFAEINAEIGRSFALPETQDEPELEKMKKRRSSIIEADLLNDRMSLSSISSSEEIQRRLSSLILTGQVDA